MNDVMFPKIHWFWGSISDSWISSQWCCNLYELFSLYANDIASEQMHFSGDERCYFGWLFFLWFNPKPFSISGTSFILKGQRALKGLQDWIIMLEVHFCLFWRIFWVLHKISHEVGIDNHNLQKDFWIFYFKITEFLRILRKKWLLKEYT